MVVVVVLLIIIVIQLNMIYSKLPPRPPKDYVAEALERDRKAKEQQSNE